MCDEQKENELDSHKLFDMFNSIYACPMPVIGRINGNAIGGGSGLVSACDFAFSVRVEFACAPLSFLAGPGQAVLTAVGANLRV